MKNTAIVIPTRLGAKRFPNKPLAKINNVPMIIHVLNRAKESKIGEVCVATPDDEIFKVVQKNGGKAILTKSQHQSGSDRVYEAYIKDLKNKVDLIINLQGDMPNIKLEVQRNLEQMRALENNLVIKVGFSDSLPVGVDTEKDLIKVSKEMQQL